MSYFTTNLRFLRMESGSSEDAFASAFDISVDTLLKLENGLTEPGIGLLLTISKIFGCTVDSLLCKDLSLIQDIKLSFSCRLLALDIDGVLTDGGMYYTEKGDEFKKFHTRDGMAIKFIIKNGIEVAFISSGFNRNIIESRAKLLGVSRVYIGTGPKLPVLEAWCSQLGIGLHEVAFVGDDVNDLEIMKNVGLAACPADAVPLIRSAAKVVLSGKGGDACVREFIDGYIMQVKQE